jgi:hypothetical protein
MEDKYTLAKDALLGVIRFLDEHGYAVKWDEKEKCYRVVMQGLNPEHDEYMDRKFETLGGAYYYALNYIEMQPPH